MVKTAFSFWWKTITSDFLNFSGRLTRRDFFTFLIVNIIMGSVSCGIFSIWSIIPCFGVYTRRLNDAGHSWKALLWSFVCGIGGLVPLYLCCFKPSQEGTNAHGAPVESQC